MHSTKKKSRRRDSIIKIGRSVLQHGKLSDRVYIMKLDSRDMPGIGLTIERLARDNGYSKIFGKVPDAVGRKLLEKGYSVEARVPKMYKGKEDGLFVAKYTDRKRKNPDMETVRNILAVSVENASPRFDRPLSKGFKIRRLAPVDADCIAGIYSEVFETYPFPIQDPAYITDTMMHDFLYFGVFKGGELAAVSSMEIDPGNLNVEMTDFATLPRFRGHSLAAHLLKRMDAAARDAGFDTCYTIARAGEAGMNITFARNGYKHAGTLYKNTNIGGGIEDMNVWYKNIG